MMLNRKRAVVIAVLSLSIALIALHPVPILADPDKPSRLSDHALINGPGGDTGAKCGSNKAFVFYMTLTNVGSGATTVQVKFLDGDSIPIALGPGQTVSVAQSAGGTQNVDGILTVVVTNQVVGWVSLMNQKDGAKPPFPNNSFCITTP